MKLLLLGATGQLGKEWQSFLAQNETDDIELLSYTSSQLDITHYREVSDELRKQKPDVVVNCAAYTDVDGAEKHRKQAQKINVEAVLYLAELSQQLEFKLVHYSTDYVFPGSQLDKQECPRGYPEDHPADPINWYGKTKWEGEQAIRNTTANHLIIRVSWLCGQFGSNFVKTMLKLAEERDSLQVVDDQWGSPTFTEEVVKKSLALLKKDTKGTYHLCSKGLINWYEFAQTIFTLSEIDITLEAVDSSVFATEAERPSFSKLNTQKLADELGSEPVDWKEGLTSLLKQLDVK
ncbi:dTDP-4-dehydrorhamnose reductase [Fodinibius halophilus]|uniref:dTDP-4-dehydrorhamnose reductase n=1 Tax=Fodinibius halophilus TaxID=1736908 RepID=A0A6M1T3M1_9BACT|nr:dTDP-4-dehydrorhamnose reductase [Fodinibius halophilus]NGP87815.1 dTDP-4-dehydrorhamnose reductase [Fodinibius halophilus]